VEPPTLSTTEHAVLGVLAQGPSHGFAVSKTFATGTELGRVLTVRRPLVYRALDRLVDAGLARPLHTEKGDAGPQRVVLEVTDRGRRRLRDWLSTPVTHVRDLRIEFLLKLAVITMGGDSPIELIRLQRATLEPTLSALDEPDTPVTDHVELWRRHNAAAAGAYLDHLELIYRDR